MLETFANAAWLLETEKRQIKSDDKYLSNNSYVIGYIDYLIGRSIRTSSNLVIPKASIKALRLAQRLNINLFAAKEGDKSTIKNYCLESEESDYFFYEHKETVYELRKKIAACNTSDEVLEVFRSQEIVWVLNSENEILKSNGHNSIRPDSTEAYKLAAIEVENSIYTEYQVWRKANWSKT